MGAWIGVDLDGTLATYESGQYPQIGEPIPRMVAIVKEHLRQGDEVRIFTARACGKGPYGMPPEQYIALQEWLREHVGQSLPVTAVKDFDLIHFYDDRAKQVVANTGVLLEDIVDAHGLPIPVS